MKRILLTMMIVAGLGGGGWFWWSKQHAKPVAAIEPEQEPVSVVNSKLAELHQSLDAERDLLLAKHAEKRYAALADYATKNPDAPDVSHALEELVDAADELFRSKDVVAWADLFAAKKPPRGALAHAQLLAAEALGRLGRLDDAVARFTPIESDPDPNIAVDAILRHAELLVNVRDFKAAKALYKDCGERFHDKALSEHLDRCKDELDRIGDEAPSLDVKAVDGTTMSLGQDPLKSKVVLVEFWSASCQNSRAEMPLLKRAYEKWRQRGFEVVGVNIDADNALFDQFVRENGLTWRHVREPSGWDGPLVHRFDVEATPSNVLIDRAGRVARVDVRGRSLGNALASMLGE